MSVASPAHDRAVQRVVGVIWLLLTIALAAVAWQYHTDFSYEPVGPRAYPLLCLGLMALGLAWWILRPPALPHDDDDPPMTPQLGRKIGLCMLVLLGHAALFEPLGFIVSTTLAASLLARLCGGRPWPSVLAGACLAVGMYVLFDRVLEVPLPMGVLSPLLA